MPASQDTGGTTGRERPLRRLRLLVVSALGSLVVLGALASWRLSQGPISLDRFKDAIEQRVDSEISPLSLELGEVSLLWHGWAAPLEVRVRDARVRQGDGATLLTVAEAALAIAKGPLLRGVIAPVWLEFVGGHGTLVRGEDGRLELGFPQESPPDESESLTLRGLAGRWLAPTDPDTPLGRLTTIRFRDASLRFEDRVLDLEATADRIDVELQRGQAVLDLSVPLNVTIDGAVTPLTARITYRLDEGRMRVRLDVPELEPAGLAGLDPRLEVLSGLDLSVELHLEAEISGELEVETAALETRGDWGSAVATVTFGEGSEPRDARVRISALEAWRFAGLATPLERLEKFRRPLHGEIDMTLEGGEPRSGTLRLHGDEGADDWGEISGRFRLAGALGGRSEEPGSGDEDAAGQIGDTLAAEFEVQRLKPWMFAGLAGVEALEGIHLPLRGRGEVDIVQGEVRALHLEMDSGAGQIALPRLYPEPLTVHHLVLEGRARDGFDSLHLDRLTLDLGDLQPTIKGQATGYDGGYTARAALTLGHLPLDRLPSYWPPALAGGIDRWITEHVPEGNVRDVVFEVAADVELEGGSPPQNATMSGSMAFDGVVLDVLAPKPPVQGVSGTATLEGGTWAVQVTGGKLSDLEIEGADVTVTALDDGPPRLAADITYRGEVGTVLELLSGDPLDVLETDGLEALRGKTRTRLRLGLDLIGPERNLEWTSHARISEGSWPDAPLGLRVTEGEVTLDASPDLLEFDGTARFNGIPAEVEHRQVLGAEDASIEVHVRARLDEEGLTALGLPDQPYLSGTTGVDLRFSRGVDGLANITVDLDLRDSQLDIREIDWHKPVGRDGGATVVVQQKGERAWSVPEIDVSAGELSGAGSLDFELDPFRLVRVDLPHVQLPDNRLEARLYMVDDSDYHLRVHGRRYHLQPALERLRRGRAQPSEQSRARSQGEAASANDGTSEADEGLPPFALEIRFDELYLSPEARLDGFEASIEFDGDHYTSATASASVEPEGDVYLFHGPDADGYRLEARADGAGEVLAALTGSRKAQGGKAEITLAGPSKAGPFEGRFEASGILLQEDPLLERVLTLASLEGLVDAMTESHLKIDEGKADLTFESGVLGVKRGRFLFSGLLISLGGSVDFPERQGLVHVAIAPLGRVQRFVSKIPLLGRVVTGWDRTGYFATHCVVRGSFEEPEVEVIPMSTLAPGILRDILGLSGGGGGDTPEEKP